MMGVFRRALKISCELSSIQALPRITKASTQFQIILWTSALLIGSCFCGYQFVELLIQYFKYPTSVAIKEINGSPPFPDVTICHMDLEWTMNKLQHVFGDEYNIKNYVDKINNIMRETPPNSTTQLVLNYLKTNGRFSGYLQNIKLPDEDKLVDLVEEYFIRDCTHVLVSDMMSHPCNRNETFKVVLDPIFGLCITLQNTEAMGLNLLLYLDDTTDETGTQFADMSQAQDMSQSRARVIIHPHNSFPDINFFSNFVLGGTKYDFDLVGQEKVSLPPPYGTCVRTDQSTNEGKSSRHGFECYRLCGKTNILQQCNCLHLYYAQENIESNLCARLEDNISITTDNIICALNTLHSLSPSFKDICDCPKPCQEFEYEYTSHTMPWPHYTYHLSFYTKYINGTSFHEKFNVYDGIQILSRINQTAAFEKLRNVDLIKRNFAYISVHQPQWKYLRYTETPLLSAESFIGGIGGLFNLWAGLSFFTLIEIMEFIYLWFYQKKEKQGDKEKSLVENKI